MCCESTNVHIPWHAWYGDEWVELSFPPSWQVQACWPADAPDVGLEGIERAFENPVSAPTIEALARGKRWVSIAVDDISRPTPAARLMPPLLRRLEKAGVDLDRVRVVLGVGMHRPMVKENIVKKIGRATADRLEIFNGYPYGNVVDLGVSARGTPVHICRFFMEADLKMGIGCIIPHMGPAFSGGAKVVIPGVAGVETILIMHEPGRLKTGMTDVDHNELRAEIEQMVREKVGLDCVINAVTNSRREIAGLFVGDMIRAHRAGVQLGQQVYATAMPTEPVDIAVCNAYPKDTEFGQNPTALNVLSSSPRPIVKTGGTIVIITASPEGRGHHGLCGSGMCYNRSRGSERERAGPRIVDGASVVYFSPNLMVANVRNDALFNRWEDLIKHLIRQHGDRTTVAVFPCGTIQLALESVAESFSTIHPSTPS
jgi:nickel-dependent lactate racemase